MASAINAATPSNGLERISSAIAKHASHISPIIAAVMFFVFFMFNHFSQTK